MILEREKYCKEIIDKLALLQKKIELSAQSNLQDSAVFSEDFIKDLLNVIFRWSLINLNSTNHNQPGIDLHDLNIKVAVQVTSDNERSKIDETINKFISDKMYEKYSRLIVFLLKKKPQHRKEFDTKGCFSFNSKRDILDFGSLFNQHIKHLSTVDLRRVHDFVSDEIEKQPDSTHPVEAKDSEDSLVDKYVQSIRVFGSHEQPRVELRGTNLEKIRILSEELELSICLHSKTVVQAILPFNFEGLINIIYGDNQTTSFYCAAPFKLEPGKSFEVVSSEIPLYEDELCTYKRSEVVGILKRPLEGRKHLLFISPTYPGIYKPGMYIDGISWWNSVPIGETWYRDPSDGEINYAWTSSLISVPYVVGQVQAGDLGGIAIFPSQIKTEIDELKSLKVIGWIRDGKICKEVDITDEVTWKVIDESFAEVQKSILHPKRMGRTKVECRFKNFFACADVTVAHFSKGDRFIYFQGLNPLAQIRSDAEDNLYLCNQSGSVYKYTKSGELIEVIHLSTPDTCVYRIDCLAVDSCGNIYVNDMLKKVCLKFSWNGKNYQSPKTFATVVAENRTIKGIAIDKSGDVFVGVITEIGQGYIICINPDGVETFFPTYTLPFSLALDVDGNICVPSSRDQSIHIYDRQGNLLRLIPYRIPDLPSDVVISDLPSDILIDRNGAIYLSFCSLGRILKIYSSKPDAAVEVIANKINSPGGMAIDSRDRLFVSHLQGDCVEVIYQ